ncbi:serine/threonine-protein kinase [Polyangium mundeleinium]|uniref:Serine/threonine-protein kinase n=1 Tax=Polyangium mundeleinium TaxID=2995306 RepID=A0ABT5F8C4_9BACT|nr:serine/threonine-protein kinase [Polyangium mundeleinium]MDC0749350.1 serine/threonine-protein kinase [Polyangium mundeleinium]
MSSLGDVGAGHTLGRYELLVPIAQGGMAVVWAARMKGTRGFQKIVAVKTMLPELSQDPQFEDMFLAEAGLASRIRHPHVCEILDLGEQDGLIYIVMEWIDGEPLSQLARAARQKGGVPMLIALRVCLNAALGLHAAHELQDEAGELVGLVHRDVSPQNILVTYDGVVKIVDFGVAKATAVSDTGATKDGQLKGKVPFMSPEQALGKAVDRRTDVFALGIVLYQLLASKHPFRGDNDMITLRRICDKEPAPSLLSAMPNCPPLLNEIVMKALEKEADKRYLSMAEFARALDRGIAELKLAGQPDEDVVAFVRSMLGERAEKRRTAIREGLKVADERAEQREQLKAQRAALLAQARANGGTIPPGLLGNRMPTIPPGLQSIPPPSGSMPDIATIAHGRASLVPGTLHAQGAPSSPTAAAIVADVDDDIAAFTGGGKKKLAVVFAAIGVLAIVGAVLAFSQGSPTPEPATQPAVTTLAPAATMTTPTPTPLPSPVTSAAPATSATTPPHNHGAATTKSTTTPTAAGTTKSPSTKSTGTTKPGSPDNLPSVRDPGF